MSKLYAGITYEDAVHLYANDITRICVLQIKNPEDAKNWLISSLATPKMALPENLPEIQDGFLGVQNDTLSGWLLQVTGG